MNTWRIAAGISCCLLLTTGCCQCQHPYDNCGPVWSQGACQNCNPDYRAGSVLNRHAQGVLAANDAPRTAESAPRVAQADRVAARKSDESAPQVRATTVAQRRRTPKPAPADGQPVQSPPKSTGVLKAPSPNDLPAGTVAAPAGTKEGDTRILSVTDRRLDEPTKGPQPVAAQRKAPQRTAETASEDLDGWRPAAPHQDPVETATQSREIVR